MHGGAVALAEIFNQLPKKTDVLLATSMLDLTTFLALTRGTSVGIPTVLYLHENQLTYPWSPQDRDVAKNRNHHYSFINYVSALAADYVLFNSSYHRSSFLEALPRFLQQFPDRRGKENVKRITQKSEVLPLGLDLERLDAYRKTGISPSDVPIILWNHRWEYDKCPEEFFQTLFRLKQEGISFRLVVLGEQNDTIPAIFPEAKERLASEILHWGYTPDFETYAQWLWKADILPVTSRQDFFGGSVVEAMYCNCYPLLPHRLAYPGHVPEAYHQTFLYQGELYPKLEYLLKTWPNIPQIQPRRFVEHYSWGRLINKYDALFTDISEMSGDAISPSPLKPKSEVPTET